MACLVTLHLRHSVDDLEKPSHPSHNSWKKCIKLLRDLRREDSYPGEYAACHFCVDDNQPNEVVFMYPYLHNEDFTTLQASLASEGTSQEEPSTLRDALTPLLKEPPSTTSAIQFDSFIYLEPREGPKCLEFLTARYPESQTHPRQPDLEFILLPHSSNFQPCTFTGSPLPDRKPVESFSNVSFDGGRTQLWCIEWASFQARNSLFQSIEMRTNFKNILKGDRAQILKELAKSEDDLTWEEDLQVYFRSTGASEVRSQLLVAKITKKDHLEPENDKREIRRTTVGCRCLIL